MSEAAREQRIAEAKLAAEGDLTSEKIRIPWKDEHVTLTVVSVPIESVVLNPRSHRIRADLESHPDSRSVIDSPYSDGAQAVIADVIGRQPGFSDLCESLREHGQREPGVVSSKGVLVNANRRAIALRETGQEYIRVGVLPTDAGQREIEQLELRLQMQKEYKEPYSFTNELIFVKDLVTIYGYDASRVAIELGWAASSDGRQIAKGRSQVEQYLRILDVIREFQQSGGSGVPITRFDGAKQSLIELDDAGQRLIGRDAEARRLRDMRIAGMVIGLGYEPLRQIDGDFVEEYLYPRMSESDDAVLVCCADALTSAIPADDEPLPGIDVLEPFSPSTEDPPRDPRPLLDLIVAVETDHRAPVPAPPGMNPVLADVDWLQESLRPVIVAAAEEARDSRRAEASAGAPVAYLDAAISKLRKASEAYDRAHGRTGFDKRKFEFKLKRLAKQVEELQKKAGGG